MTDEQNLKQEDALFSLKINSTPTVLLPNEVVVKLKKYGTYYACDFCKPYYPGSLTGSRTDLARWSSLLDYVCEKLDTLTLVGTVIGNKYYVKDLYSTSQSQDERRLLRHCIDSIRAASPVEKCITKERGYTLSRFSEFEQFYKICGHTLPENLQAWLERTLEIARTDPPSKKTHALMAMKQICNINWNPAKIQVPPLEEVKGILDSSLYGMDAVKDRMLEIFAQIRNSGHLPKWGVLLNGPAGTGKSTIAKLFAKVLGLGYFSIDFSSLCDMEAVAGSSRIYDNGRVGIFIDHLYELRSSRAVMLISELDKSGKRDSDSVAPSDVLLSILDKLGFSDVFIEETVPTDNIFCIATCNDKRKISKPLLDRFFVIDIPAYGISEKRQIWSLHSFPDAKKRAFIAEDVLTLSEEAEMLLLSDYAVEPGARDLEKYAERFTGHYCRFGNSTQMTLEADDIREILGPGKRITRHFNGVPGLANTIVYHDGHASFVLIEASARKGTGKFKAIGSLPEQQKAFCEVAYECVCNSDLFNMSEYDVTVFVPHRLPEMNENFIGCAAYAAIVSALTGQTYDTTKTAFIGGTDLHGNLYFDSNSLAPVQNILDHQAIEVLYAPLGTGTLSAGKVVSSVAVLEAPTVQMLVTLAGGMRNKK